MKQLFIILFSFASLFAQAQIDSADRNLTVRLPVKAVVLYGAFMSESPSWLHRRLPEQLNTLIGSGTQPDSIVQVTIKAVQLSWFVNRLLSERYGAFGTVARSIINNTPATTGYTALATQVNTIATGNTSEKAAALYVISRYNASVATMADLYNQYYQTGLNWIRD